MARSPAQITRRAERTPEADLALGGALEGDRDRLDIARWIVDSANPSNAVRLDGNFASRLEGESMATEILMPAEAVSSGEL